MDLELTDEQQWLSESVETLLERETDSLWQALVAFGALAVDREEGLGAVELCLVSRALGAHLASVPYLGSAAVRFAAEPLVDQLPEAYAELAAGDDTLSIALLEPGGTGLQFIGRPGWRIGDAIGVLTTNNGKAVFQSKDQIVEATPDGLRELNAFEEELRRFVAGKPN